MKLGMQILAAAFFKLLFNTSRRFVYPFAPALGRSLGVPLTAITPVIAVSQASSLLGLVTGPMTDAVGYQKMMRVGLFLLSLGSFFCAFFPSYWPVVVGLLLAGLGKVLFDPSVQSFVGRTVPFANRGRAIGIVEISWAGATLLGVPLLGLLIAYGGFPLAFFLLGFLAGCGFFLLPHIILQQSVGTGAPEPRRLCATLTKLIKNRPAAGMLAFSLWINLANDMVFVVYGIWLEKDFSVTLVALGMSTVAIGLAELLGECGTAILADRVGVKGALIAGVCCAVCAYILLPFCQSSLGLALFGIFLVFASFEFTMVTGFSLGTELLPEARATMMAGVYASAGVGRMLGVILGGTLWALGGIFAVAWFAAFATFLGLVFLLWGIREWQVPAGMGSVSTG